MILYTFLSKSKQDLYARIAENINPFFVQIDEGFAGYKAASCKACAIMGLIKTVL
jgi:hypothetical protein